MKVNFQSVSSGAVEGWLKDSGDLFGPKTYPTPPSEEIDYGWLE